MTREEIGALAGPIYEALKDGKTLTVTELKKVTGLSADQLNLGLGWLFCENNIYAKEEIVKKKSVEVIGWRG
ncbi:MAG: winged helix-turn-helix domain-containing protein [Paludibacteraceae bacterium]|nr:winged helix-turn-helix domain-containing protein [Candidatus Physcocola equi]MCQ2233637.1 winged helix-turn-helix domain-containing protein [Paludibacteraceae bacterium]